MTTIGPCFVIPMIAALIVGNMAGEREMVREAGFMTMIWSMPAGMVTATIWATREDGKKNRSGPGAGPGRT